MGRNNKSFFQGGGFHFSPKENRKSIEKHGLRPGNEEPGFDDWDEPVSPSGVYVYDTKDDAEHVVGGTKEQMDIWRVHVPLEHLETDDHLMSANASFSREPVSRNLITRVGHTTASGEIHWHPEENCNG